MEFIDHYHIIGVKRDAAQDQIRQACRRLAHNYHTDVSTGADTEPRFSGISEH